MEITGHKKDKDLVKDRHSHSGMSGSPKKGGAGGKGTWGKGGIDDLKQVRVLGNKDPNYDSEEEEVEEVVIERVDVIAPIEAIIQEFLTEGDISDAVKSLKEVKGISHPEFVRKCVARSMDKTPFERELVSKLLSSLYNRIISPNHIGEGFQQALDKLDDISLDAPTAPDMLGKFLARAIFDEIIPPVFLTGAVADSPKAKEAIHLAQGLINDPHRSKQLEHIWGPGDLESVKRLKKEAHTLLEEYLVSGDTNEAEKAIRQLNAPHFLSQIIKYALQMSLSRSEEDKKKLYALLSFLSSKGTSLVTPDCMNQGFKMCRNSLEDIKLDAPNAPKAFEEAVQIAKTQGFLVDFS